GSLHPPTSQGLALQLVVDDALRLSPASLQFPAAAGSPPVSSQFISSALRSQGDYAIVCRMMRKSSTATARQSSDPGECSCRASQVKVSRVALRSMREIPHNQTTLVANDKPN